jgi:CheY-like chemotaxis protein
MRGNATAGVTPRTVCMVGLDILSAEVYYCSDETGEIMRILAVEDEPEYLEMLEEVMKEIGHTISVADSAQRGLEILHEQPIDVVVSDVRMPEMDGLEFHRRVRSLPGHANTPFIFLTGVRDLEAIKAQCSGDCDLFLQKPFPVDKLIAMFTGRLR